jgi:hypothetical protein
LGSVNANYTLNDSNKYFVNLFNNDFFMSLLLVLSIYTADISNKLSPDIFIKWMQLGKRLSGRLEMQTEFCVETLFENDYLENRKCDKIFILRPISRIEFWEL